jgi:hypothetical protein
VLSVERGSRVRFSIEPGVSASESVEVEVGACIANARSGRSISLAADDGLFGGTGIRVNFSIPPGANPSDSAELDFIACIARVTSGDSGAVAFAPSLSASTVVSLELGWFPRGEDLVFVRTGETRLRDTVFDVRAPFLLRFRREDLR